MRLPGKGLRKQEPVSGLEAKIRQRFVIGSAHVGVDLDETRDRIARAVWIKLVDDLLHEGIAHLQIMNGVLRLLLFGELKCDRAGHVTPHAIAGEDLRNSASRRIPRKSKEREQSRLADRHRPGPICLIADAYARFTPTAGDAEGCQIGHAEIEVVLFRIDTQCWELRHHRNIAFQTSRLPAQVVRRSLNDQCRFAISKLRSRLDAGYEAPGAVGRTRRLSQFPHWKLGSILLNKRSGPADAVRVPQADGYWCGLPDGQNWSRHLYDGRCRPHK